MKLSWKREILPAVLAAGMFVAAFYYYPLLPNSLPVHFGLKGQPNGWASKPVFFLENTGIFCFTYLLLTFLPFIDPLKRKIEPKFKTVILLRDVILVFSAVVYFVAIEYARAGGDMWTTLVSPSGSCSSFSATTCRRYLRIGSSE